MSIIKNIAYQVTCLFFAFNFSFAQNQDTTKELKNYYYYAFSGSNYRPSISYLNGKPNYNSYNYSSFSLDGLFDYERVVDKWHSILSGIELVERYNANIGDSLKLSESFIQIPLALGFSAFKRNNPVEVVMDIGPYIDILLGQQIIPPDNSRLPSDLKESYPAFSYFKWGAFIQIKGIFYFRNEKEQKIGFYTGIRLFGEEENSAFAKSSGIKYTSAYSGMSYLFGGIVRF